MSLDPINDKKRRPEEPARAFGDYEVKIDALESPQQGIRIELKAKVPS